jgi:hypothetical protein
MGNASGRHAVTRKSSGKQDEKVAESHEAHATDDEVLNKENVEPSGTKVDDENAPTKENITNGHSTNGHVAKDDGEVEHAPTIEATDDTNKVETCPTEDATASHNVSTTSESKKSNPLKWLKKNISFKKEKRSKKKDTSTLEENVEGAETKVPQLALEDTPAPVAIEAKPEETPSIVLTDVEAEVALVVETDKTVAAVPEPSTDHSTKETPSPQPHPELNGHTEPETVTPVSSEPITEQTSCEAKEVAKEPTTVSATPESHEVACNGE